MIVQESSTYPIDSSSVHYYFCIHRYKKREAKNICNFVLLTIQKIKKRKGRYFKRYIKKKEAEILKKRSKMLGFVLTTCRWETKTDGGRFRAGQNGTLLLRGGKLRDSTKKGITALKPHSKKIVGAISTENLKKKITNKYVFLKLFRFRTF